MLPSYYVQVFTHKQEKGMSATLLRIRVTCTQAVYSYTITMHYDLVVIDTKKKQ